MTRLSVRASFAWLGPGRIIEDAQVVCDGGRITYAGTDTPIGDVDEELVVDGFLMPAVADRHVHIELSDPAAVLRDGVTAVRDLAWPPERIFPLADASEMPSYNGPLIRAAGPMLTGHGGYPTRPAGRQREPVGSWPDPRTPSRRSPTWRPRRRRDQGLAERRGAARRRPTPS